MMDVSENFENKKQQIEPHQQQDMQCDPDPMTSDFSTNSLLPESANFNPLSQTAIPLPAPFEVNKPPFQAPPTSPDIDSMLLQQFSCLGTTDHEDLITQFQSLMNNQMNKDSAKFFLEMSNWNLQTAVGCYLDYCNFITLPSMKIVEQNRPNELQQIWRLQNDGSEAWPKGCYLMSPSQKKKIEIPVIPPGESCDILADIPSTQHAIMWRMCTPNGWYFGEPIWMIPPGTCDTQSDLADRMSQLRTSSNPENVPQINVIISINME